MGDPTPIHNKTVLIAEDEVLVRLQLADTLTDAGYTVYEASGADEAIAMMEKHPEIEVLITDIDMPGSMDGLKLSHFVRHKYPPVRIIVASSHVKIDACDLPERGVYLGKPYDTPKIQRLLAEM